MGMKQILAMMVVLVGCSKDTPETSQAAEAKAQVASKPSPEPVSPADENLIADPVVEAAIRESLDINGNNPTGELTKADLGKVAFLGLAFKKLTEVPKGLEKLTQLTVLHLHNNQLTDVKGLGNLTQLKGLSLIGNQLTDVKGLEKLTQLESLLLQFNQLTDVKGLEKLNKLIILSLGGNQLTDVKGLEKLTQLKELILLKNPDLTKAQIDELQKALPNCKIYSNPTK